MLDPIKRNLLKYTLLVDGIVCTAAGAGFLGFSSLVAEMIGPASTGGVIVALGAFLVLWGLFHLAMSRQDMASAGGVRVAIAGDALWIVGSIAVLVMGWDGLTSIGAAFIAVMTVAVADIMLLKMKGMSDRRRVAVV
ncbi:hypothetical protein [Rhizobium sp.]